MASNDPLNIAESRVMYNAQGEPEFMLVPIKRTQAYPVTDGDIVTAVDSLREKLIERYNAETNKTTA